jgi:hypothetical protein
MTTSATCMSRHLVGGIPAETDRTWISAAVKSQRVVYEVVRCDVPSRQPVLGPLILYGAVRGDLLSSGVDGRPRVLW